MCLNKNSFDPFPHLKGSSVTVLCYILTNTKFWDLLTTLYRLVLISFVFYTHNSLENRAESSSFTELTTELSLNLTQSHSVYTINNRFE